MSDLFISPSAALLEQSRRLLAEGSKPPDLSNGLACKVLTRAGKPTWAPVVGDFIDTEFAEFRRAPVLAAYGYVLDQCGADTRREWLNGIERLRGREAFPGDGDSFVHNPKEVLGIYSGLEILGDEAADHKNWFRALMRRGLNEARFRTPISSYAASLVLAIEDDASLAEIDVDQIEPTRLLLAGAITLAFAPSWETSIKPFEAALLRCFLSEPIDVAGACEAAAATILVERLIDRLALGIQSDTSATERVVGLCRRFPLFVDQLQSRQRGRPSLEVNDEYDVQDLIHAVLKLHFDDVRPEEPSASFGGKASRVDFFLPNERIVVEAKMTRSTLKQDKVVSELIEDTARYSKMLTVDTLICLVYDPEGHCTKPHSIENDVEESASRLKVRVIVCPRRY